MYAQSLICTILNNRVNSYSRFASIRNVHYSMSVISIKNNLAIKSANSELVLCFSFRNTYSYLV